MVTKDIPDDTLVIGVPAKTVRTLTESDWTEVLGRGARRLASATALPGELTHRRGPLPARRRGVGRSVGVSA